MPQPTKQHLQLVGGANSANSTLYTSTLIKTGDTLKITGTGSNDGVFTVTDVVNTLSSNDAAGTTFDDNTCDKTNTSTTVTHDANAQIIAGLSVSGVPSIVASVAPNHLKAHLSAPPKTPDKLRN